MLMGKFQFIVNYLFFFAQFFAIFFAPSVYTYATFLLKEKVKFFNYVYLVSLFIGCIPIYLYYDFCSKGVVEKQMFFEQLIQGPYPTNVTFYSIVFYSFQEIVFVWLLLRAIKIKRKTKDLYADYGNSKLNYVINFLRLLVVSNLFIVVLYLVFDILFVEYILLPIIISAIYSFIIYNAFKQSALLNEKEFQEYLKDNKEVKTIKTKFHLDEKEATLISEKIKVLLDIDKVFIDANISLDNLSKLLNEPTYKVSHVLNDFMKISFYDLINSKRIEEAKKLLENKTCNYTVEGVGLEVGYKSRSTFYRAYKKYTGKTPAK